MGDNLLYRGVSEHKIQVFTAQQKIFMRHFELFFRLCDFFSGMKWSAKTISRAYPTAKMSLSIIVIIEVEEALYLKEKLGINQRNRLITFRTTVFGVANHKLNSKLGKNQQLLPEDHGDRVLRPVDHGHRPRQENHHGIGNTDLY